jgi:hypothetical protein
MQKNVREMLEIRTCKLDILSYSCIHCTSKERTLVEGI